MVRGKIIERAHTGPCSSTVTTVRFFDRGSSVK